MYIHTWDMGIKIGTWINKTWRSFVRREEIDAAHLDSALTAKSPRSKPLTPAIAPDEQLAKYLLDTSSAVEIDRLELDSPALERLKQEGFKILVPLISQGELIGSINLGARMSEQQYSTDDRRLLNMLATQAGPALHVAQLVQKQQAEARELERIEQELRVARVIQQTLLPQEIPQPQGWRIATHWQPARAVSGDFYDFYQFPDGRMGVIIADVTDKGVPAALVMASTRSILSLLAMQVISPGKVLEQANNILIPNMPENMYVTCLYAVIEPRSGYIQYANAGHPPPYRRTRQGVVELMIRGMPLGLFPDMQYEEKETVLNPGDDAILYSDGLVEAHNPNGDMFGFSRLKELIQLPGCGDEIIRLLLQELADFTGPDQEQEDDVTFLSLERLSERNWG